MGRAIYTPSDWGREFHSLDVDEALGAGCAGPGKTTVLRAEFLPQLRVEYDRTQLDRDHPDHIEPGSSVGWALYLRRTHNMLEQEKAKTEQFFRKLSPGVKWRDDASGGRTYQFPVSGYRYQLGACHDIGDYQRYMSNEYTLILPDEVVQFDEEQYDQIMTRARTADHILRPMIKRRSMSNPLMEMDEKASFVVRDPEWVRRRFIDPAPEGRKILSRRVQMDDGTVEYWTSLYLPAKLSDNPDKNFAHDYEKSLQIRKPHIRRALLRGDWYVVVGAYYSDDFDRSVHVVRPFRIPASWGRARSMDWGFKKQGVIGWWFVDNEDNWGMEREYTFQYKLADEVARETKAIEIEMGLWDKDTDCSSITGPADDQLWEQRGDVGKTKAETFAEAGIHWVKADKNHKRACELITGKLRDRAGGVCGLVFFENCRRTIIDMMTIRRDPHDPDKPLDTGLNHWHDQAMYLANYASRGVAPPARKRDRWEDDEDNIRKPARGSTGYGIG